MAKLVYLIGASGSGKDSLIRYVREKADGSDQFVVAHRYITRAADDDNENHIALSKAEFTARLNAGLFALHWHSHDTYYGIGIEVFQWLDQGLNVLVNGSRGYLPIAQEKIDVLEPALVCVDLDNLKQRLVNRGRETELQIQKRIVRAAELEQDMQPLNLHRIDNNGELAHGGEQLWQLLTDATPIINQTKETSCA